MSENNKNFSESGLPMRQGTSGKSHVEEMDVIRAAEGKPRRATPKKQEIKTQQHVPPFIETDEQPLPKQDNSITNETPKKVGPFMGGKIISPPLNIPGKKRTGYTTS